MNHKGKELLRIIPGIRDQSVTGKKGVPTAFQRMEIMMKKLHVRKQISLKYPWSKRVRK